MCLLDENPSTIGHGETHRIDMAVRNVGQVKVSDSNRLMIKDRLSEVKPDLEAYFNVTLNGYETAEYLIYRPGSFYTPHRDVYPDENMSTDDRQRRISVVIFLGDEVGAESEASWSGGQLMFYGLMKDPPWDKCGLPIIGETGLMVAFPSELMHEVTPVTSGVRYTIVSWFF